jgi:predicted metal-dependent enzyme (double-stranded beta helix superfamily)
MLGQRAEVGIDTVLNIAGFDASLANLESNLAAWISRALAASDLMTGLSLLRQNLEQAIFEGRISLPARFSASRADHYARRLIFADPRSGVSVLAMVWAPGQGTPLHDHSGLWGVEAVLAGEIETVPFELTREHNGQYFFQSGAAERVTAGSTSYLMPPFEYHVTRNVGSQVAITLNIYAEEMSACNIFLPNGLGSYTRERRLLSYSD